MFRRMFKTRYAPDYTLLAIILSLLLIGAVMVYSSSYVWAEYKYADQFFYLKRQLLFCGIGIVGMLFFMAIPYSTWKKYSNIILLACFLLLLAVLIPGIGMERGGAQSWIGVGAFSIQPSEFMKLGLIIFLAVYLSVRQKYITSFKKGFFPSLILVFTAFGLIMLQPDLGTGVVLVGTCMVMIYIAGARLLHFFGLAAIGVIGFLLLILSAPYQENTNLTAMIVDYGTDERVNHRDRGEGVRTLDIESCWGESTDVDDACYKETEKTTHTVFFFFFFFFGGERDAYLC